MGPLPFDIIEAIIQCFGRSFYYKDAMEAFLVSGGVGRSLARKYRHEPKFVWARKLLADLSETEEGRIIQRRILTELCKLRSLPDSGVQDRDAGIRALTRLKDLAYKYDLVAKQKKADAQSRERQAEERSRLQQERARKLDSLRNRLVQGFTDNDRQRAGYSLEDLLRELFAMFEIEYRKPYRTSTQQIDGHFKFDGFDYLVEAKWQKDMPTEAEILAFKGKVDSKLESTRGLFISVYGFRDEVARKFDGTGGNIILMDGQDLMLVLEGFVDLREGLRFKIEKAAQEGKAFVRLREMR